MPWPVLVFGVICPTATVAGGAGYLLGCWDMWRSHRKEAVQ
jgi:hypothetical protein